MYPIPLPESPRLGFRFVTAQDLDFVFLLQSDPALMRYIRTAETDLEVVRLRIESFTIYNAQNPGLGIFILEYREEAYKAIGYAALRHYDFNPDNEIEVGYVISAAYAGIGIATEVTQTLTQHAYKHLGATKTVAFTDPENTKSNRVLTKCGYRLMGIVEAYGDQSNLFERLKDQ